MVEVVAVAAVQSSSIKRVGLSVKDVTCPQHTPARSPAPVLPGPAPMQEVGRVKQQVQVFNRFSQKEGLHPVVELVVSEVFHLQQKTDEDRTVRV